MQTTGGRKSAQPARFYSGRCSTDVAHSLALLQNMLGHRLMALALLTALLGQCSAGLAFSKADCFFHWCDTLLCFLVSLQGLLDLDVLAHACGVYKPPPGAVLADEQDKQARGIKTFNRRDSWGLAGVGISALTQTSAMSG